VKVLTKNTDYAIRALMAMGGNRGTFVSTRVISNEHDIPYPYLRRIVRDLIENGLVKSREGAGGGVMLNANPSKIRVIDIINIFQGNIEISDCMFRQRMCANRDTCVLRHEIKRIENILVDEFKKITIQRLIDKLEKGSGRKA
jgi:Rrf2 family protein